MAKIIRREGKGDGPTRKRVRHVEFMSDRMENEIAHGSKRTIDRGLVFRTDAMAKQR